MGVYGLTTLLRENSQVKAGTAQNLTLNHVPSNPRHEEKTTVLVDGWGLVIQCLTLQVDYASKTLRPSHRLANALGGDLDGCVDNVVRFATTMYDHYGVRLIFAFDGTHKTEDGAATVQATLDERRSIIRGQRDERHRKDLLSTLKYLDDPNEPYPRTTKEAMRRMKYMLPPGGLHEARIRLQILERRGMCKVLFLTKEVDAEVEALCAEFKPHFVISSDSDMVILPGVPRTVLLADIPLSTLTHDPPSTLTLPSYSNAKLVRYFGLSVGELALCAALTGNDVTGTLANHGHEKTFDCFAKKIKNGTLHCLNEMRQHELVVAAVAQYLDYYRATNGCAKGTAHPSPRETDPSFPLSLRSLRDYGIKDTSATLLCYRAFGNIYDRESFQRLLAATAALVHLATGERSGEFILAHNEEREQRRVLADIDVVAASMTEAKQRPLHVLKSIFGLPDERLRQCRATGEIKTLFTTCVLWAFRSLCCAENATAEMDLAARAICLSQVLSLTTPPGALPVDDQSAMRIGNAFAYFTRNLHKDGKKPPSRLAEMGHGVRDAYDAVAGIFSLLGVWDERDVNTTLSPSQFFAGTALFVCDVYRSQMDAQYLFKPLRDRAAALIPRAEERWLFPLPRFYSLEETLRACAATAA